MNRRLKVLTAASLTVFCLALTGQPSEKMVEPSPVLDKLLEKIAAYKEDQSRANLAELEDIVHRSHGSPQLLKQFEKQFLEFLRSDATLAGKQFVCRQLSVIGTEDSIPTLAAMLTNPETSEMARYALERIPGAAVDQAMRNALDKTTGKAKIGIIGSLGDRRDKAAVTPLSSLLNDTDKEVMQAAAASLGKIASPSAAAELHNALKQPSSVSHAALADAYLTCAYNLAASGDKKAAADIYKELYIPTEPAPVRSAALTGIVTASPEESVKLVVDAIKSGDPVLQPVAISLARQLPGTQATQTIAAELPNLSAAGQVQLLSALADRKDPAALPAVVTAAKAPDQQVVRIAALKAMASLGGASTAILLAQTAAVTDGDERQAARESLYLLNSPGVNETIIEHISKADPKIKVELVRSIGQRDIRDATQTVLKTANDPDSNVRLESIKVLKDLAQPQLLSTLVDVLINSKSDAELKEAGIMVSSIAHKSAAENTATTAILKVLGSVKAVNVRCALLETLGNIGDANSLGVLRTSLGDGNAEIQAAAIRALSDWPNAAPSADLLKIAQSSSNQTHRTLALRGYVRLIGLDTTRSAEETVKMFRQAMDLTANYDERKMILAALADAKSIEALQMTVEYMDNRNLNQEAAAAVIKIAESTLKINPDKTKAALQMALNTTKNDSLKQQAQQLLNQIK